MPTPYYEANGVTLYHGDSREIIPTLEPVDFVVTDPPWLASKSARLQNKKGATWGVCAAKSDTYSVAYGDIGHFEPDVIRSAISLACYDSFIHCGYMELGKVLSFGNVRAVFTWHTLNPMPIPGPLKRRDSSFIVWLCDGKTRVPARSFDSCVFSGNKLNGGCCATERIQDPDGKTSHPSQEPLWLYRKLVGPLDGVILDPYAGTGTTLVAAAELGRKAIGIELEEKYCELIARRLEAIEEPCAK